MSSCKSQQTVTRKTEANTEKAASVQAWGRERVIARGDKTPPLLFHHCFGTKAFACSRRATTACGPWGVGESSLQLLGVWVKVCLGHSVHFFLRICSQTWNRWDLWWFRFGVLEEPPYRFPPTLHLQVFLVGHPRGRRPRCPSDPRLPDAERVSARLSAMCLRSEKARPPSLPVFVCLVIIVF